jgi:hypothetical protein
MSVDFGKAINFVTQEPNWVVKVLIGGLITFLGLAVIITLSIIGGIGSILSTGGSGTVTSGAAATSFILSIVASVIGAIIFLPINGYMVSVTRNVINGQTPTTPDWSNFGNLTIDGAKVWVCTFVVTLPGLLLSYGGRIPTLISPASTSAALISTCGSCLSLPLFFFSGMIAAIVIARYATTGDIGRTLNFSEIFATLRANLGMYALITIALVGLAIPAVILGFITCGIGLPFLTFFLILVSGHLYGQAHLISQGGTMQPAYGTPYGGDPYGGQQRPF